jgi:diaminohydroxyphosphoribosylaminopyrimidine deaminase/5-amino-6-(5-phosphoribosylamino)uracil reductase
MTADEQYMFRCLELAQKGTGAVAPNPKVGSILVFQGRIIGEGYHKSYGGPHAEVECLASVAEPDRQFISSSTLYVSLEPCSHQGKTPPCADMIIRERIPVVVIGCRDPFPLVNGSGIGKLAAAGILVKQHVLEADAIMLNKRFFTFHQQQRPYIILKWAQTLNGMIAGEGKERLQISNSLTNLLVHQWRSEEAAILIGTETALIDNPRLTSRIPGGKNPVRLVIDRELRLPKSLHIFDTEAQTIIFNTRHEEKKNNLYFCRLEERKDLLPGLLNKLYSLGIQSVLVEGGKKLHESFIQAGLWDEIRRISSSEAYTQHGYHAPELPGIHLIKTEHLKSDRVDYFQQAAIMAGLGRIS